MSSEILVAGNWHPLTWISHALDYAVWGSNPLGHHLTNNVLHAASTFIVVMLVVKLIEAAGYSPAGPADPPIAGRSPFTMIAAATTGLLSGLHPLHVDGWRKERISCVRCSTCSALRTICNLQDISREYFYLDRGIACLEMGETELAVSDYKQACELGNSRGCELLQSLYGQ